VDGLRKKEFSSFDIAAAVKELGPQITHSRVNNIYQFGEKTFVFKLHKTDAPPFAWLLKLADGSIPPATQKRAPLSPRRSA
jgi:predicted ribosome quality control (RQC) complex YloA/Tae2 family protein